MLPYYLLTGASLAGGALPFQRSKYRWGYLLTMGLACWLLASLRYVTGFDYRFYESAFQSITVSGLNCQRRYDFVVFRRTGNVEKW